MNPAVPTWAGVAASLALVAAAVAIAWRQRLHLAREITIAAGRAGVQLAAVAAATGATIGTLLALGLISTQARVVIPVGGMIVSGAMAATAVTLTRLREEAAAARPAIETRLCLGQPAAQAFAPQPARRAAHRADPLH